MTELLSALEYGRAFPHRIPAQVCQGPHPYPDQKFFLQVDILGNDCLMLHHQQILYNHNDYQFIRKDTSL